MGQLPEAGRKHESFHVQEGCGKGSAAGCPLIRLHEIYGKGGSGIWINIRKA
jgi:hypothetical protein